MKKNTLSTVVLILVFVVGLGVMLYPTVSDWWNSRVQTRAIVSYNEALANLDTEDYTAEFTRADEYNAELNKLASPLVDYDELDGYEDTLNVLGNGIIGYVSIPQINVELPIYHGTSVSVLNVAVGHLEGTSLPVGGESTHTVLSAHRGLPSAKLFSDLDKLVVGDTFTITVLDRTLTYMVDQIRIVEPSELEALAVVEGEDYCTLLTCTPYGVNTHRLLVRGTRVENAKETVVVTNEAYELDSTIIAPLAAAPILLALLILLLVKDRRKRK